MSHNKNITDSLKQAVSNFPIIIDEFPDALEFSIQLDQNVEQITQFTHTIQPHTLIHGDYKLSNIFLLIENNKFKPYTIDWQWMGKGSCSTDVAYFMYTSLSIEDPNWSFQNESENDNHDSKYPHYSSHELCLLHHYFNSLKNNIQLSDYNFEDFEQQYSLNVIYFTIFCIRNKWSNMSKEDMEYYKNNHIDGLHLRNTKHMIQLIKRSKIFFDHLNFKSKNKQF